MSPGHQRNTVTVESGTTLLEPPRSSVPDSHLCTWKGSRLWSVPAVRRGIGDEPRSSCIGLHLPGERGFESEPLRAAWCARAG